MSQGQESHLGITLQNFVCSLRTEFAHREIIFPYREGRQNSRVYTHTPTLILLHSERPKLYEVLAFLSAIWLILFIKGILTVADLLHCTL